MKRSLLVAALTGALALVPAVSSTAAPSGNACWGQATKAFAQTGRMGEHASSFETPRLGLRNLARDLHAGDVLADDSMQALGAFVAEAEGLEIDACS